MSWWKSFVDAGKTLFMMKWEYNAFIQGIQDGSDPKTAKRTDYGLGKSEVQSWYNKGFDLGRHQSETGESVDLNYSIRD